MVRLLFDMTDFLKSFPKICLCLLHSTYYLKTMYQLKVSPGNIIYFKFLTSSHFRNLMSYVFEIPSLSCGSFFKNIFHLFIQIHAYYFHLSMKDSHSKLFICEVKFTENPYRVLFCKNGIK